MKTRWFCLLLLGGALRCIAGSPNDEARYLAGLPLPESSPLARYTADPSWQQHSAELDQAWVRCEQRSLSKTRAWASTFVRSSTSSAPCYYMFSGPDFLYAHTIYPNASTYVLCGIEPVGSIPDFTAGSPAEAAATLATLRRSLSNVLRFSYFITKEMRADLGNSRLTGTLPILYVFLARQGCAIERVEFVGLNASGALGKGNVPGVRIVFRGMGGTQTLYYFKADLSNGGSGKAVMNFCQRQGSGLGLLKAASYLLHENSFSQCRDFLLNNCRVMVQDDSGIPHRYLTRNAWQIRYFGNYAGTTGGPFAKYYQEDLAQAYAGTNAAPLDFQLSYQWNPKTVNLVVATPTGGRKQIPALTPPPVRKARRLLSVGPPEE